MDTMSAFVRGQMHRDDPVKVFDWHQAARRIRETKPEAASAGLQSDWEWTGGEIFRDGESVPADRTYTYLASCWAIPELSLDGDVEDCWIYADDSPGWDAGTYWPESALTILKGEAVPAS